MNEQNGYAILLVDRDHPNGEHISVCGENLDDAYEALAENGICGSNVTVLATPRFRILNRRAK